MEKYITLYVLSLTVCELGGQIVVSNIRGPSVISNLHAGNTNPSSVLTLVNSNKNFLNSKDSHLSVVSDGGSVSVGHHGTPVIDDDDDDDDDFDFDFDFDVDTDSIGHASSISQLDNGALLIQNVGPGGFSIEKVQNGNGQSTVKVVNLQNGGHYITQSSNGILANAGSSDGQTINLGSQGISIHKVQNGWDRGTQASVTDVNNLHTDHSGSVETINLGPGGISIHKEHSGPQSSINVVNNDKLHTYHSDKAETINVGPAGILIHKVHNGAQSNTQKTDGDQTYYSGKVKTINVGPAGISIHKGAQSNTQKTDGDQTYYSGNVKTINVGPAGISIHKVHNGAQSNTQKTDGDQNYYSGKVETINVGPQGIAIQKTQNIHDGLGQQNNFVAGETINVSPSGVFIHKSEKSRP